MSTDGIKDRLIRNEQLLRDKNTDAGRAIKKFFKSQEEIELAPIAFMCECSQLDCDEHVHTSIQEYQTLHKKKNHFTVHKGHEIPEIEKIILSAGDYYVVEKPALAA